MIDAAKNDGYTTEADSVANAVGSALNSELETLTDIATNSGKEALSEEINNIVQNTVVQKIQTVITGVSTRFGKELSGEVKNIADIMLDYDTSDFIQKLQVSAGNLFDSTKSNIGDYIMKTDSEGKGGLAYKTLTGIIAAATNIVSPILEVIIIMLPDILNFIFGKVREQNKREKIKEAISSQIPSIKRQVRIKVIEVLKENSEAMINAISKKFDEELSKKQAEIEESMQRIENDADIAEKISRYEAATSQADKLLEALL